MTNSFQKLGENLNVMNENIMSLVQWPEDELSEDISEQLDVNYEASEKHSNDEQNADESATGQAVEAEPPSKRKKSRRVSCGGRKFYFYSEKILSSLEKLEGSCGQAGRKLQERR